MKCVSCGNDVAPGAIACPECGARLPLTVTPGAGAAVPPADAVTAPRATPVPMAFRLDVTRWTRADRVTGGAALVLFVSLFLPWFSVIPSFGNFTASSSADALTAHGYLYLVLLLTLAMLGYLIARASLKEMPELPSHRRPAARGRGRRQPPADPRRLRLQAGRRELTGQGELEFRRLHRADLSHRLLRADGRFGDPGPLRPHRLSTRKVSLKKGSR